MPFPRTGEPGLEIAPLLRLVQLQVLGAATFIKSLDAHLSDDQDWRAREAADSMLAAAENIQDAIDKIVP